MYYVYGMFWPVIYEKEKRSEVSLKKQYSYQILTKLASYLLVVNIFVGWQLRIRNHPKRETGNNSILKLIIILGKKDKNMKILPPKVMSRGRHISLLRETICRESRNLGQMWWWPSPSKTENMRGRWESFGKKCSKALKEPIRTKYLDLKHD